MLAFKEKDHKLISWQLAKRIIIVLVVILIFDFFLFPASALASEEIVPEEPIIENIEEKLEFNNNLPTNQELSVKRSGYYTMTAYNSEVSQTDGSPCITANGFNLCKHGIEDSVAANFLRFGTKIRIPEFFGDRVFVVRDRMNKRYQNRVDIWMLEKSEAIQFGVKVAKIEVLDEH